MRYALDTNTVIYYFRGTGRVAEHLLAVARSSLLIPAIVAYELEVGALVPPQSSARRELIDEFLVNVQVQPFGLEEARAAADVRVHLQGLRAPIGPHDLLIAGTALANNATLVTRNVAGFARVPGLSLINWFD